MEYQSFPNGKLMNYRPPFDYHQPIINYNQSNMNYLQSIMSQSNYINYVQPIYSQPKSTNNELWNLNQIRNVNSSYSNTPTDSLSPCSSIISNGAYIPESTKFSFPKTDDRSRETCSKCCPNGNLASNDQESDTVSPADFERLIDLAESLLKYYNQTPPNQNNNSSKSTNRQSKAKVSNPKRFCKFCKNNNEPERFYQSHRTLNQAGEVVCPILKRYVCPLCKASGSKAHTRSYCPQSKKIRGSIQDINISYQYHNMKFLNPKPNA